MQKFVQRFKNLAKQRSAFCLGVDPTSDLLKAWGLEDNLVGLNKLCNIIAEAADGNLAIVKLQSAYFERFGPKGMEALQVVSKAFQDQQSLVIFDAKRGDIGSTVSAYAQYLSNKDYSFDAITALAYMGFDALKPMLDTAVVNGKAVFIVVRSSNSEGDIIQNATIATTGQTIAEYLAEQITSYNQDYLYQGIGPIGAVVGATLKDASAILEKLPNALVLSPGLGFQGSSIEQMKQEFSSHRRRIIPTASRSILATGPDIHSLRKAIKQHCQETLGL